MPRNIARPGTLTSVLAYDDETDEQAVARYDRDVLGIDPGAFDNVVRQPTAPNVQPFDLTTALQTGAYARPNGTYSLATTLTPPPEVAPWTNPDPRSSLLNAPNPNVVIGPDGQPAPGDGSYRPTASPNAAGSNLELTTTGPVASAPTLPAGSQNLELTQVGGEPPPPPLPTFLGPSTSGTTTGTTTSTTQSPTGGLAGTLSGTTGLINQLIQQIMNLGGGEPAGLSAEAKRALTTQALETVPGQFDRQASDLATMLLRRGGGLPAGGDYNRAYGRLLADREAVKSGLLRDVILEDERQRQKNRELNLQAKVQGLQTVATLTGQLANIDISTLDMASRERLAQMGIDSNEKIAQLNADTQRLLGQLQSSTQLQLGTLDADTRTRLAQMGIDSQEKLAAQDTELRRELAKQGVDANQALGQLDADTRIKVAEIQAKAGSSGAAIIGSILSSLAGGAGGQALVKGAIDAISGALGGGAAAAGAGTAGAGAGAAGGFGASMAAFFTNPFTIGIGAALGIGVAILKSQAHWEANEYVQTFQNPFFDNFAKPLHDSFFEAAEQGQLTKQQAQTALNEMETAWAEFLRKSDEWARGSSDKTLVTNKAYRNKSGVFYDTITNIIENMRKVAEAL